MATAPPSNIIRSKVRSDDGPSEMEKQLNIPLEAWKETQIEPKEESDRRYKALRRLDALMRAWIRQVMINEHRMSDKDASRYEGKIYTTGSFRYNVHTSGSDIDAVLIAPKLITRDDFFGSFLAKLTAEPLITEITPVKTARVPIIAMKFDGVEMDLSFGAIQQEKVPEEIKDDLLRGLDDAMVRSANAPRVAHQLLAYAPVAYEFRTALRFIKHWAKVRGIHGSQYGFPTGIGWAILVCHVCQCYPNKNAAGILASFFRMFNYWYQPDRTNTSIFLSEKRITSNEFGRSWDPSHRWDAQALFPVLTPVAPSTNACEMVTKHTLRILCREFKRGHELISAALLPSKLLQQNTNQNSSAAVAGAMATNAANSSTATTDQQQPFGVWSTVLENYPFFETHQRFLHLQISTVSAFNYVEHYKPYVDCIESRLNRLSLLGANKNGVDLFPHVHVRPWPRRFEDAVQTKYVSEVMARQRSASMVSSSNNNNSSTAADLIGAASPNNTAANRGSINLAATTAAAEQNHLPPLVPPSNYLTCHIYIGLDVVEPPAPTSATAAASTKTIAALETDPAFTEELRNFVDLFANDQNVFKHGITLPPVLRLETLKEIPLWIFDPSKSKVLKKRAEDTAAARIREAEEEERKRKLAEMGIVEPPADDAAAAGENSEVIGTKRPRSADGDDAAVGAGGNYSRLPLGNMAGGGVGFAGVSSIPSAMTSMIPSAGSVGNSNAAKTSSSSASTMVTTTTHTIANTIAIAQSVVSAVPIISAPALNTDVNVDDELGMDF